jgi:hypothetical protein
VRRRWRGLIPRRPPRRSRVSIKCRFQVTPYDLERLSPPGSRSDVGLSRPRLYRDHNDNPAGPVPNRDSVTVTTDSESDEKAGSDCQ